MLAKETKIKIKKALTEDIKSQDITTNLFISPNKKFYAQMKAKSDCVVCGTEMAAYAFKTLNSKASVKIFIKDGKKAFKGDIIMTILSDRTLLCAERTALNIVQRLSAISSAAAKAVKKAGKTVILDTRKTTPLWRLEEKYAVKTGGARNHRFGLYDAFMIKDNHIAAMDSFDKLKEKICQARKKFPKILEIEAQNLNQAKQFAYLKPDILMLDNMTFQDMKKAIKEIRLISPKTKIELSGGIKEKDISKYSKLKADFISLGYLTHSVKTADISLEIKEKKYE